MHVVWFDVRVKKEFQAKQLKLFDIFVERINEQPIALRSSPETRESRVQDYRSHALFVCQMNFESFVDRMLLSSLAVPRCLSAASFDVKVHAMN